MLSITSEIYFRDLNLIQEKQKNEPQKKNGKFIHRTHFKAWERGRGMITVIKEKITVNQDIQNSREVC